MDLPVNRHRTIIAKDEDECRKKLYDQYGTNYSVIDKREIFQGRFIKKKVLEFTYVVGNDPIYRERTLSEEEVLNRNREQILKANDNVLVKAQLNQLNDTVQDLINNLDQKMSNINVNSTEKQKSIQDIEALLEENEFTPSFIKEIEDKIRSTFSLEDLKDFDLVQRKVVDWIGESISIAKPKVYRPPHVYIIVGPTGVGKTTTLVKLAAEFKLDFDQKYDRKCSILFLTTDTMRVGALEQLNKWANPFNAPVYKAVSVDNLIELYEQYKDQYDAIFIDTSGYSPNDAEHLAKVKNMLNVPGMNPDIYLAVSATTKSRDLENILRNYEAFRFESVIVTKCDESLCYGNVISLLHEKRKSISYVTTGQLAPQDIERASVINFLIRLANFKVDRLHIEQLFGE